LLDCDAGDFDVSVAYVPYLDRHSRRLRVWHQFFVDLVHLIDVVDVGQVDVDTDDVRHLEAGLLDHLLDGAQGERCLCGNVEVRQFTGGRSSLEAGDKSMLPTTRPWLKTAPGLKPMVLFWAKALHDAAMTRRPVSRIVRFTMRKKSLFMV
jgi:hypothetical protein